MDEDKLSDIKRPGFMVYFSEYYSVFSKLGNSDRGDLFMALLTHAMTGEDAEPENIYLAAFYNLFCKKIDEDWVRYNEVCEARRRSVQKRWANAAAKQMQSDELQPEIHTDTNEYTHMQANTSDTNYNYNSNSNTNSNYNTNDNYNTNTNNICIADKPPQKTFKVPSVDDVREYCRGRNSSVNPEKFVDYYTANGWKVGKNSMKDWKAAVRCWEKAKKGNEINNDRPKKFSDREFGIIL